MLEHSEDIIKGKNEKAGVIILFLSPYRQGNCMEYEDENGNVYQGVQTNDAPMLYLENKAKEDGYPISEIICIKSIKVSALRSDNRSDIGEFKDYWNQKGIKVSEVEYDESLYLEQTDRKNYDKLNSIKLYQQLSMQLDALKGKRIYIDYTGGLRDISFLMTTMVYYLEFRGIQLGTIAYSQKNASEGINRIVDITYIYDIFRMIYSVNEFLTTGSARKLNEFFENAFGDGESLGAEREWMYLLFCEIKEFSEAMSICNIREIEDSVKKIATLLKDYQHKDFDEKCEDAEQMLFYDMLQALIPTINQKLYLSQMMQTGKDGIERINYPWLIKWCSENYMIQQATTLYIEKIPVFLEQQGFTHLHKRSVDEDVSVPFYSGFANGFFEAEQGKDPLEQWFRDNVLQPLKDKKPIPNSFYSYLKSFKNIALENAPEGAATVYSRFMKLAGDYERKIPIAIYGVNIKQKNFVGVLNSIGSNEPSYLHYLLYNNEQEYYKNKKTKMKSDTGTNSEEAIDGRYLKKATGIDDIESGKIQVDVKKILIGNKHICSIMRSYLLMKIIRNCLNHAGGNQLDSSIPETMRMLQRAGVETGFSLAELETVNRSEDIIQMLSVQRIRKALDAALEGFF